MFGSGSILQEFSQKRQFFLKSNNALRFLLALKTVCKRVSDSFIKSVLRLLGQLLKSSMKIHTASSYSVSFPISFLNSII